MLLLAIYLTIEVLGLPEITGVPAYELTIYSVTALGFILIAILPTSDSDSDSEPPEDE